MGCGASTAPQASDPTAGNTKPVEDTKQIQEPKPKEPVEEAKNEEAPAAKTGAGADASMCQKIVEFLEKASIAAENGGGETEINSVMEETGITYDTLKLYCDWEEAKMNAGYEV